jgi:hypothetical protein
MSAAAIHLWMAKGIFMPETYVPKPSGRSRGCRLSIADMVTVGILHSLFALGATFHEIQDNREIIRDNPMSFYGLKFETSIEEEKFIAQGRPIRRYLEQIGYDCLVVFQPAHVNTYLHDQNIVKDHVRASVTFVPATEKYRPYLESVVYPPWERRSDENPKKPTSPYRRPHPIASAFISVRDWYEVVREGLAAI